MEGNFFPTNWGCDSLSSVYRVCSIFFPLFSPSSLSGAEEETQGLATHFFYHWAPSPLHPFSAVRVTNASFSPRFLTQQEYAINSTNLLGLVLQKLPTSEFVACDQGISSVASQDH